MAFETSPLSCERIPGFVEAILARPAISMNIELTWYCHHEGELWDVSMRRLATGASGVKDAKVLW